MTETATSRVGKVIDYILELAQVTERQVSFDELRADEEDKGDAA